MSVVQIASLGWENLKRLLASKYLLPKRTSEFEKRWRKYDCKTWPELRNFVTFPQA
jgi:hypothetical protein